MALPTSGLLVADAGPLIILAKCDQLHLLSSLFASLHVPQAVVQEALFGGHWSEMPRLREFLKQATLHENIENVWVADLRLGLHEGEIQAMALAIEMNALVLMDQSYGRKIAALNSVAVIGTLGVLIRAKLKGLIPLVRPIVEHMIRENYSPSEAIVAHALRLAGELE